MNRSSVGPDRVRTIHRAEIHWRVFEHTPEYDRRARATLVFDGDGVMRRVRTFPANWHELTDDELIALSECP